MSENPINYLKSVIKKNALRTTDYQPTTGLSSSCLQTDVKEFNNLSPPAIAGFPDHWLGAIH